jgi:hypothetical protein
MFYGLTQMEDYFAEKVSVFVAIGPVTKLPHSKEFDNLATDEGYDAILEGSKKFGIHALGSNKDAPFWRKEATFQFCKLTGDLCQKFTEYFMTEDTTYDDTERYYVATKHAGGSTPLKSILHYA